MIKQNVQNIRIYQTAEQSADGTMRHYIVINDIVKIECKSEEDAVQFFVDFECAVYHHTDSIVGGPWAEEASEPITGDAPYMTWSFGSDRPHHRVSVFKTDSSTDETDK